MSVLSNKRRPFQLGLDLHSGVPVYRQIIDQVVGGISGIGNLVVGAGSGLTANDVQQTSLVIGGTATSFGILTIAPSDANGNPLPSAAAASERNSSGVRNRSAWPRIRSRQTASPR